MYNNERIGIGIITCNRRQSYKRLFDQVNQNNDIDVIVTVKNKDFDYGQDDPQFICQSNNRLYSEHVSEDLGVGYCKNICFKKLIAQNCDHIFLIEDDINIKNNNVFKIYIDTAKSYHIQHLNFCMAWDSITKKYLTPSYSVKNSSNLLLSVFKRLCGDFQYFTKECIQQVGLFDAKNYINALEHAEHTYRISSVGMTLPFQAYADIYKSSDYIEDTGIVSSIHHDDESIKLYKKRIHDANAQFVKTYGRSIGQIHVPTSEEIKIFLLEKLNGV